MTLISLYTSSQLQSWLKGQSIIPTNNQSDDESESSDNDDTASASSPAPTSMDIMASLTAPRPRFYNHGILLVLPDVNISPYVPLTLFSQTIIALSLHPQILAFPHVDFAVVSSSLDSGTPRGPVSDYLQVSVTPTVILFSRTPPSTRPTYNPHRSRVPPPSIKRFSEVRQRYGAKLQRRTD